MSRWFDTDKWKSRRGREGTGSSDKVSMTFSDLDPVDVNLLPTSGPLVEPDPTTPHIFGKYTENEIRELLDWSGVFEGLRAKGYDEFDVHLQYLSELDQRIFVRTNGENLIHLRLKVANFRFRLHPHAPERRLLYIDWLNTRHIKTKHVRPERLFPGQDLPGLGIFGQLSDFMANLALGVGARGMVNIPEYFHDALLFHRFCKFYDPEKEINFRGMIRDLRGYGARRISAALAGGTIRDARGQTIPWTSGEMLSALDDNLEQFLWTPEYHRRVAEGLTRVKFRIIK